jgi:hypothetical protein
MVALGGGGSVSLPAEGGYVAECFWVGVTEGDLRALDERAGACVAELVRKGENVRYLGSVLMRADEVVLCLFEGSAAAVQHAAERAQIPFERLVEGVHFGIGRSVTPIESQKKGGRP